MESQNVLVDSMEEMIFEMLLHLQICHPVLALQHDLVEGIFQPCDKGGNLLMVPLHYLVEILLKDIE